jgi:uncharacterized Fe-S cluster-containing MiaB family protein
MFGVILANFYFTTFNTNLKAYLLKKGVILSSLEIIFDTFSSLVNNLSNGTMKTKIP